MDDEEDVDSLEAEILSETDFTDDGMSLYDDDSIIIDDEYFPYEDLVEYDSEHRIHSDGDGNNSDELNIDDFQEVAPNDETTANETEANETEANEMAANNNDNEPNEDMIVGNSNTNESENNENEPQRVLNNEVKSTPKRLMASQMICSQSPAGENCIICMEPWTNSSEHRIVSLSCGHLFGKSCIEKWIQSSLSKNKSRCPQCNAPAKKKDIRNIYAKSLRVVDTSERDRALQELEAERQRRKNAELMHAQDKIKLSSALKECERLRKELMESNLKIQQLTSTSSTTEKMILQVKQNAKFKTEPFQHVKDIEINPEGGCRLIGYSNLLEVMAVSQKSCNPLFPGWGVKKVSTNDFKSTEFIIIHEKPIKDIAFNQYDGTILTSSQDKTVKLTSLLSKSLILSYKLEVEAWSVAFNPTNKNEFFAGLRNGKILLFDTRMTSSFVDQLESLTQSPVVSLNHIDHNSVDGSVRGLLSAQLDTISLHERYKRTDITSREDFTTHQIPCDGVFTSSHFEPKSGHVLISCRPSKKHKRVTHYVLDLSLSEENNERTLNSHVVQYFEGGTEQITLTKSRIFAHPYNENSVFVCAGDEETKGALIWDSSSSSCVQKLSSDFPILDLSLMHHTNTNNYFMAALNEKSLKVYKCIL